jgi:hypothetical protein
MEGDLRAGRDSIAGQDSIAVPDEASGSDADTFAERKATLKGENEDAAFAERKDTMDADDDEEGGVAKRTATLKAEEGDATFAERKGTLKGENGDATFALRKATMDADDDEEGGVAKRTATLKAEEGDATFAERRGTEDASARAGSVTASTLRAQGRWKRRRSTKAGRGRENRPRRGRGDLQGIAGFCRVLPGEFGKTQRVGRMGVARRVGGFAEET